MSSTSSIDVNEQSNPGRQLYTQSANTTRRPELSRSLTSIFQGKNYPTWLFESSLLFETREYVVVISFKSRKKKQQFSANEGLRFFQSNFCLWEGEFKHQSTTSTHPLKVGLRLLVRNCTICIKIWLYDNLRDKTFVFCL